MKSQPNPWYLVNPPLLLYIIQCWKLPSLKWKFYGQINGTISWCPSRQTGLVRLDGTNFLGFNLILLIADVTPFPTVSLSLYVDFSFET